MASAAETPAPAPWWVCHTRPRCEKKFAALLAAERFPHYLPVVESVRRYGTQTKRFSKPLFPGYVFAQVPLAAKARLYQQELLARAIAVEDEARLLRQMADVRAIVASGYAFTVLPLLTRGRPVRIIGGALQGLEGRIDDAADPAAVVIAVDVLQRGLRVRVPATQVRPLP
jgi:transcription antitermination factor NusG